MSELKMKQYRRIPVDERTRKTDDKFHFHHTRVRENMQQAIPAFEAKRKRLIDKELIIRDQLKTVRTMFYNYNTVNLNYESTSI